MARGIAAIENRTGRDHRKQTSLLRAGAALRAADRSRGAKFPNATRNSLGRGRYLIEIDAPSNRLHSLYRL